MTPLLETPADDVLAGFITRIGPDSVMKACRDQMTSLDETRRSAWHDVRMVEALYHPGRYIRVAYAFLPERSVPSTRLWPESDVVYVHAPVRQPVSRRGQLLTIDGQDFEAYRFPNDRRLRGLRKFASTADALRVWQQWLDQDETSHEIHGSTLQRLLMRYVPEHKWVVRLRVEASNRDTKERTKRRMAVRCASPESCRVLQQRHAVVSAAARDSGDTFRVPAVVGADIEQGLLAVEWNRGEPLIEMLQEGDSHSLLENLVAAIASFHATPVPDLDTITTADVVSTLKAACEELSQAYPNLAARLSALFAELEKQSLRISVPAAVTLHNDLHHGQVRFKKGRMALLDLERMCVGDPLIDVANFAVQLRMLGDRRDFSVSMETATRWSDEFVDAWARHQGAPVDAARFRCYAVRSLIGLAHGLMRHLRVGAASLTQQCLDVAEIILSSPQHMVTAQ